MLEAYEVAAVFKLHDEMTAKLKAISEQVGKLNLQFDDINEKLAAFGRGNRIVSITNKLRGMNAELTAAADRASAAGAALDSVAAGGGFVVGRATSREERAAREGEGRAAHNAERDWHLHGYAPLGPFHARVSAGAGIVGAAGLGYGAYENARMNDAITRMLLTAQVPIGKNLSENQQYQKLRDIIQSVAMETGAPIRDIEEGALNVTRMLAGFKIGRREQVMRRVLSFSALEHYLKPSVSVDEASTAMVGLMHMSGKYKPKDLNKLSRVMMGISLVTPLNMTQIERAASYAVPVLRSGMGMKPTQVMGLLAMMQRSGLINTKSGTWARSFFEGLVPGTMGSGLFKVSNQQKALAKLGLVDWSGHSLILDKSGHVDVMKAIRDMKAHLKNVPQVERIKYLEQAFGKRGGQFASLLMTDQFKKQWPEIQKMIHTLDTETELLRQLYRGSQVQQARVAREELTVALMNLTTAIMGPLSGALNKVNEGLKWFIKWEHDHKKAAAAAGDGALGLLTMWGLGKLTGTKPIRSGAQAVGDMLGVDAAALGLGALQLTGAAAAGVGFGYGIDKTPYLRAPFEWLGNHIGGEAYDLTHGAPTPSKHVTVHTNVHLDGRKVGESVSHHLSQQSSGPISGTSGLNGDAHLLPPNLRSDR